MRLAYYLDLPTPHYLALANKSIARARKMMPGVEIVLLAGRDFPETGLDVDVVRLDLPMDGYYTHRKCLAYATQEGDVLCMDVDCIIQRDVRDVFDDAFDLALCLKYHSKMVEKTPFNSGVAFTRSQEFWRECAMTQAEHQSPVDLERQFSAVALNDKYHVKLLNGDIYNYSPNADGEDLSRKAIVHYKGKRKEWMCPLTTLSS